MEKVKVICVHNYKTDTWLETHSIDHLCKVNGAKYSMNRNTAEKWLERVGYNIEDLKNLPSVAGNGGFY